MVLGGVMITRGVSAQNAISSIYFPYPPDVIPPDLAPEKTKRVNREVSLIEAEALTQWHALPINSGTAITQVQILGRLELFDRNLSVNHLRSQKRWLRPSANPATYDQWGQPGIQIRCALSSAPPMISTPTTKHERGNL